MKSGEFLYQSRLSTRSLFFGRSLYVEPATCFMYFISSAFNFSYADVSYRDETLCVVLRKNTERGSLRIRCRGKYFDIRQIK
jgi:hypothetical protein